MGANIQSVAPCQVHANFSEADDETISQWTYSDIETNISLISRSIILSVGMVGNCAFLIVIAKVRSMHTLVNVYLVHLAIADIIVLLLHTAVPIFNYIVVQVPSSGHWFGAAGCMATMFFKYLGYFTSIILVCLVSTERFLAVCHPLRHRSINTKSRASKLVAFAWVLGGGFSACAIPTSTRHTKMCVTWPHAEKFASYPSYTGRCAPSAEWAVYAFDVIQAVPFFCAFVCNAVFFTRIIRNLRCREQAERRRGSIHGRRVVARVTHQVTLMLLVTGAVFFICQAPFQSISLCLMVAQLAERQLFFTPLAQDITITVFRILVYINSAANPIVYNATNSRYRRAFLQVLGCSLRTRARASQEIMAAGSAVKTNRSVKALGANGRQKRSNGSMLNEAFGDVDSQQIQLTEL